MGKVITDKERAEARRIIAVQASTMPKPNDDGRIDIGPAGAWERASRVLTRPGSAYSGHLADVPLTQETGGMGERVLRRPPRSASMLGAPLR